MVEFTDGNSVQRRCLYGAVLTCRQSSWMLRVNPQHGYSSILKTSDSVGRPLVCHALGKVFQLTFRFWLSPPLHMGLSKNGVYIIILYCIYPNHGHFMGNMTHDDSPSKIGCILFSDKPPWKIDPKQILLVRSGILKEESARWFWLVYPPRPKMPSNCWTSWPAACARPGTFFFFQVV